MEFFFSFGNMLLGREPPESTMLGLDSTLTLTTVARRKRPHPCCVRTQRLHIYIYISAVFFFSKSVGLHPIPVDVIDVGDLGLVRLFVQGVLSYRLQRPRHPRGAPPLLAIPRQEEVEKIQEIDAPVAVCVEPFGRRRPERCVGGGRVGTAIV